MTKTACFCGFRHRARASGQLDAEFRARGLAGTMGDRLEPWVGSQRRTWPRERAPRSHPPAPPGRSVTTRLLARHVDHRNPAAGGVVRGLVDAPLVPQIDRRPAVAKLDEPAELGAGRLRRVVGRPHAPVLGLVRLDDRTYGPAAVAVARMVLDLGAWVNTNRQEAELGRGQVVLEERR